MLHAADNGERFELESPTAMPRAAGFLWNRQMMIQVNCRGFAIAQFMQPEPAKYTYAPNLEAKTFMQPEQPYYAHHPGRFVYIKDEETGELFSAPYEPTRVPLDRFVFSVGKSDVRWQVGHLGLRVEWQLSLPTDDVAELWQLKITSMDGRPRRVSAYIYVPIGYMSWMNQGASYNPELGGVVGRAITPYQKVADYFKNQHLKDLTGLLHDRAPTSVETSRERFEGEGGLHNPSGIIGGDLSGQPALYETPAAVLHYRLSLKPAGSEAFRFIFAPARTEEELSALGTKYFADADFAKTRADYAAYVAKGAGALSIETPDEHFNHFVNHWLPRQIFYHGDVNRLTSDPQTRNYLQDNMGMTYISPQVAREAIVYALAQQESSGAMPDGILLREDAELKYINQIPHTDHCVWLPVCLQAYLDETDDYALLEVPVKDFKGTRKLSVRERITLALRWLIQSRDARGLSYIAQGDWCDPMNMVGYKGKGVSGWLSVATAYALNLWSGILRRVGRVGEADEFSAAARAVNASVNRYLWDGDWYARGITDDGVTFGISKDPEGRIFLNPQSWAILAGTCTEERRQRMIKAVEEQLETPYGPAMLAPAYTAMRDDVGRVTQKFPGSAENGSVYNHAAVFYIYALFNAKEGERGYRLLRQMLTGPDEADYRQRGQMPVYIPNYYRGAYYQHPTTAGRSSQLFNTGTVAWVYRVLVEGLFGLKGDGADLKIQPQLPAAWPQAFVTRHFRGATLHVTYQRSAEVDGIKVTVDGEDCAEPRIEQVTSGRTYKVTVLLPEREGSNAHG